MQIPIENICKEFDIRAEEIFAFMDEENIELGGSFMHDIAIDLTDFRKFVEFYRGQLKLRIKQTQQDLDTLDNKVEGFLRLRQSW